MARFVLVHGGFSAAWIWLPLMDRLKAEGHVVEAFDLPGMGDDRTSASEVSLDSYAGRVCEVLAANSEPAVVVGHSMGGIDSNASSGTMSRTCRGTRIRGGFLAKGRAESSRLDEASGGRRRAGASQCGRRRRASGRRHAGSGFASRVIRGLQGGRCDVGDRTAVPATSLAVAGGSIHPARSPQRHQSVLRVVHAGPGYPATIAAADDSREHVRRRH